MALTSRIRGKEAFTMIEVLIASLVLGLVFVSSIAAMTMGYKMLENARFNTVASQVIQSEIETLRLMNWSQVSSLPSNEAITIDASMAKAGFNKFTGRRIVTSLRTDTKLIVVAVSWTSSAGRNSSRRYTTFMTKNGLNDYYYTKL